MKEKMYRNERKKWIDFKDIWKFMFKFHLHQAIVFNQACTPAYIPKLLSIYYKLFRNNYTIDNGTPFPTLTVKYLL